MITAILSLVILAATFYYLFGTKMNKSKNNYGSGIVKISSLITYPIKSCAGISVPKIRLTRLGLAYDRVWLFVDCSKGSKNIFITQRQNPKLARVVPRLVNSKGEDDVVNPTSLILSAPDMPTLTVPAIGNKREDLKDKEVIDVVVWNNDLKGVVVSRECDEWITGYLGRQCRFVSIVSFDEFERKLNPAYDCNPAEDNIQTAFADGFPILLGSTASLKPVNAKMEELRKSQSPPASPSEDDEVAHLPDQPMDILQFRPNIIISGDDLKPFAEDYWKTIKFESKEDKDGGVECTVVKGCDRCILPNTDQTRGVRDQTTRVTSALKAFRTGKMIAGATKQQDRVFWGENLIHSKSSVGKFLHVGDELIVKSAAKQMTM